MLDSPLVLPPCDLTPSEQNWTEGQVLARLVLLPAVQTEPTVPSPGATVWGHMERGKMVTEGKGDG